MTLLKTQSVRIEPIVSNGPSSAEDFWFDQSGNEWVLLLKGNATLLY